MNFREFFFFINAGTGSTYYALLGLCNFSCRHQHILLNGPFHSSTWVWHLSRRIKKWKINYWEYEYWIDIFLLPVDPMNATRTTTKRILKVAILVIRCCWIWGFEIWKCITCFEWKKQKWQNYIYEKVLKSRFNLHELLHNFSSAVGPIEWFDIGTGN